MAEVASHEDLNGGGEASASGGGGGGSSTAGQGGGSTDDNICRDYQRNVCQRGSRCKYRHPDEDGSGGGGGGGGVGGGGGSEQGGRKSDLVFCHDFQNKECRRINCKFIHCSRADEDYYHSNGELPPRVVDMLHMGGGGGGDGPGDAPHHDESVPVCKDFLKGDCRRGMRCKFRHVDPNLGPGGGDYGRDAPPHFGMYGGGGGGNSYDYDPYYEPPERKRRLYGDFGGGGNGGGGGGGMPPGGRPGGMPPGGGPPEYYILEEENAFLRRKVEELKKQVGDLTATNEFLLDQNAQLRLQGKASSGGGSGGHQLGSDPAVSMAAASIGPQAPLVSYPIMNPSMRPSQGSMGR